MVKLFIPLLCACAVAAFAQAPAAAQPASQADVTLANGLRVVVIRDPLAPVVTTVMTYGVGSNDDTVPGVAHATEHMLFRGFDGLTSGQFADVATRMGGAYDAQTTNEYTQYYFTVPSQYAGLVLRLEAMRMTGAWMADAEWANERGAIEQELQAQESNPGYAVGMRLRARMFGDTPLAKDAGGTLHGIRTLTAAQIRAFYRAWYHPNNAILVVAGDVVPSDIVARAQAAFGAIPAARLPAHAKIAPSAPESATVNERADVPLSTVAFVYRYPSLDSADYAASLVLQTALDDPRGALTNLAAAGKAHGAAMIAGAYPEVGYAFVSAGVPTGAAVDETQSLLNDTVQSYLRGGVPPELIADAKRRLSASHAFELASIEGLAFAWADAMQTGQKSPLAIYNQIASVTAADVDRVLHTYLAPERRIVVVLQPNGTVQQSASTAAPVTENVAYTGGSPERPPGWAMAYFKDALHAPAPVEHAQFYVLPNGIHLSVLPERAAPVVMLAGSIKMNQTLHAAVSKQGVLEMTSALQGWGGGGYDRRGFAAAASAIPAAVVPGSAFALRTESKNFDRALALLAAVQLHPAFPQEGLDVLRNSFAQNLAAEQSRPDWTARLAMEAALYPPADPVRKHPTPASVRGLTLGDVRAWYASAYRPDLTTIAVVGDVSPQYVRSEIQKYFGSWRAHGPKPDFHYPNISLNKTANVDVPSSDARQTTVQLTELLPVYQKDKDALALELADTLLTGEGSGSQLFVDLRKNTGYVYDVFSTLDIGKVRSTYQFTFASDPKNAQAATARLLADLHHLQTSLIGEDELTRAKETILADSVLPLASYSSIVEQLLSAASGTRTAATGSYAKTSAWQALLSLTPQQTSSGRRKVDSRKRLRSRDDLSGRKDGDS